MVFVINSPAFANDHMIPVKHARDRDNVSPPLTWSGLPAGIRSFALIVEDPDAPSDTFRHWAIYNIPSDRTELPEGIASRARAEGLDQGMNDFGNVGYDGPQPPKEHGKHRYHFRLAALDVPRLDLPSRVTVEQVWQAARPHTIGVAELVGTLRAAIAQQIVPSAHEALGCPDSDSSSYTGALVRWYQRTIT